MVAKRGAGRGEGGAYLRTQTNGFLASGDHNIRFQNIEGHRFHQPRIDKMKLTFFFSELLEALQVSREAIAIFHILFF